MYLVHYPHFWGDAEDFWGEEVVAYADIKSARAALDFHAKYLIACRITYADGAVCLEK